MTAGIEETGLNTGQQEDKPWDCCLKRGSLSLKHNSALPRVSVRPHVLQVVICGNDVWGCFLQPPRDSRSGVDSYPSSGLKILHV